MRFIGPVRTQGPRALQPGNVHISHGFSTSFIRRLPETTTTEQRVTNPKKGQSSLSGNIPRFLRQQQQQWAIELES